MINIGYQLLLLQSVTLLCKISYFVDIKF